MQNHQLRELIKLWALCSVILIVLLASLRTLELSDGLNQWWQDGIARLPGRGPPSESSTVVVTVPPAFWNNSDSNWDGLIGQLEAATPNKLVLINCPAGCDNVAKSPRLRSLALALSEGVDYPATRDPEPLALPKALVVGGIVRGVQPSAPSSQAFGPSMIARLDTAHSWPDTSIVRVGFGIQAWVPVVTAEAVVAGRIPDALFNGKLVLIGEALGPGEAGYTTPLDVAGGKGMTLAELHAYTIEAVAQGQLTKPVPELGAYTIALLIVAITIVLHWLLSLSGALLADLLISTVLLTAAWLSRLQFQASLPLFDWYLAQWLTAILAASAILRADERALRYVMLDVLNRVRERLTPANVLASNDPWGVIMRFTQEVFDVKRQAYLECLPSQQRIREIAAQGCSLDEILELRRDYGRSPYKEALQAGGIIALQRPFLNIPEGETQFIAPLDFAGRLYGFWAFSVETQKVASFDSWQRIAEEVRVQVGELLFHQQQWQEQRQARVNPNITTDAARTHRSLTQNLIQGVTMLEKRLTLMEQANASLSTGYLLYDLFGNLIQANAPVEAFARDVNLKIYQLSAYEVLCELLEDPAAARGLMDQVLMQQTTASSPVPLSGKKDRGLYVYVHPITESSGVADSASLAPFDLVGVLLELIDFSDAWEIFAHRQNFIARTAESIESTTQRLANLDSTQQSALEQLKHDVDLLQRVANSPQTRLVSANVPVDFCSMLNATLDNLSSLIADRHLRIERSPSVRNCFVLTGPSSLSDILKELFFLLIENAYDHSLIEISLWSDINRDRLFLHIESQGVGLPNDALQDLLAGNTEEQGEQWKQLGKLAKRLGRIQATLSGYSDVGEGLQLDLSLPLVDGVATGKAD